MRVSPRKLIGRAVASACIVGALFAPDTIGSSRLQSAAVSFAGECMTMWVTGYNLNDPSMNPTTADGTPRWTAEPIAATWLIGGRIPAIPFDTYVYIEDLGTFRMADTCPGCGYAHIDVGRQSNAAAHAITGYYTVCY